MTMGPVPTLVIERIATGLRLRFERSDGTQLDPLEEAFVHRIDESSLVALLERARELLCSRPRSDFVDDARRVGGLLHRALIPAPLGRQLLPLSGPLFLRTEIDGIPWELLHDGADFWGLRYALARRLIITDRPVAAPSESSADRRMRALVLGADPRQDLPCAVTEAETIARTLALRGDVVCLATPLVRLDSVLDYLGQRFDVIHFAGHVVAAPGGDVGLLLGDGRILPSRLIGPAMQGQPVVVLNGCDSAGTWDRLSRGLAHGFLFGGAAAVVATVTEVLDARATGVAGAFYRHALAGVPLGEALRRARSEAYATTGDTASGEWLSFVLYGSPLRHLQGATPKPIAGTSPGISRRFVIGAGTLAAVLGTGVLVWRRRLAPARRHLSLGVMRTRTTAGDVPPWMAELYRHALTTALTDLADTSVFSQEKIDFLCDYHGQCGIAGAEALGMAKMISPSLALVGDKVALEVQIVDVASNGLLEASERVQGPASDLIALQTRVLLRVLDRLGETPTDAERRRLLDGRTADMLDSYRMLVESLGGIPPHEPRQTPPPPASERDWWPDAVALAADGGDDEAAIRGTLRAYAEALSHRSPAEVAALQVAITPEQREALERYFGHAQNLTVEIRVGEILIAGDRALASYEREDRFTDARTQRPARLRVGLSSKLTKVDGEWRLDIPP